MIDLKYGKRKVVSFRGNNMVVGGLTAKNKIDILLYISKEFANINNQGELFDRVLALCEEIFEVDNVTLRLWEKGRLRPTRYLKETDPPRRGLEEGEGFSGRVYVSRKPLLVQDLDQEPDLLDEGESTKCVCCVPVTYKESVLGTLSIEKDIPYFYKEDDLEIMEAMASQLALALNEVYLIEGLIEAQRRINDDLKMGRIVQSQIIPSEIRPWNSIHFGYYYEPMVEVSGDYFDVMRKGNSISILTADVSGHGVSAALVTVTIHHEFRRCVDQGMGLPEIMEALNNSIRPKLPDETYFTAQIMRIYSDQTFSLVNAGHNQLVHYVAEKQSLHQIDAPGLPLGIQHANREQYEEVFGKLNPGDLLVSYTDGLTEQRDAEGEETGLERLLTWLQDERRRCEETMDSFSAKDVCDAVMERWKAHVGGTARADDCTLLLMMCNPTYLQALETYKKARGCLAEKNIDRALSYATMAHQLEPSLHDNLLLMAKLYYREGQYDRSSQYLTDYIESSGERSAQTFFMLGNIYYKSGDYLAAKREFKKSLSIDYAYSESSLMLARCYLKENQTPKALKTLRQAHKSAPGNEQIKQALAALEKKDS